MLRRRIRKLLPAGLVSGLVAVGFLAPANPIASIFASYGYAYPITSGLKSAPDATSFSPNEDVFVRGTDDAVWRLRYTNGTFQGWRQYQGIITAEPGSISSTATRTEVFVRGTDNALWKAQINSDTLFNWIKIGGVLFRAPSADLRVSGAQAFDVWVIGTDNGLWKASFDSSGNFTGWTSYGGIVTSDPGAIAVTATESDVLVRGTDNGLWIAKLSGTTFSWTSLGGVLTDSPDGVSCNAGHFDMFVIGTDHGVWWRSWNGVSFSGWTALGGNWNSAATAVCHPGSTNIDLFARGTDNQLWYVATVPAT
ncbi:MAG: hypothetical protein E6I37_04265 [Chloroflexi bacterium]|nr:MAG: hypothetical protein E6I37_04265 [Chloroflexota bacterium]